MAWPGSARWPAESKAEAGRYFFSQITVYATICFQTVPFPLFAKENAMNANLQSWPAQRTSTKTLVSIVLAAWFVFALVGSLAGLFQSEQRPPAALGAMALGPVIVFAIALARWGEFRRLVLSVNPRLLTALQTWPRGRADVRRSVLARTIARRVRSAGRLGGCSDRLDCLAGGLGDGVAGSRRAGRFSPFGICLASWTWSWP